jgi:hypothetical protein
MMKKIAKPALILIAVVFTASTALAQTQTDTNCTTSPDYGAGRTTNCKSTTAPAPQEGGWAAGVNEALAKRRQAAANARQAAAARQQAEAACVGGGGTPYNGHCLTKEQYAGVLRAEANRQAAIAAARQAKFAAEDARDAKKDAEKEAKAAKKQADQDAKAAKKKANQEAKAAKKKDTAKIAPAPVVAAAPQIQMQPQIEPKVQPQQAPVRTLPVQNVVISQSQVQVQLQPQPVNAQPVLQTTTGTPAPVANETLHGVVIPVPSEESLGDRARRNRQHADCLKLAADNPSIMCK